MASRESRSSWKDFCSDCAGAASTAASLSSPTITQALRAAVREVLAEAAFQRCYIHFLRNALDHLPRKADDDCLQELRWLYDRRSIEEGPPGPRPHRSPNGASPISQARPAGSRNTIEETLTLFQAPATAP